MAITRLGGANAISGTIPAANVATLTSSNFPAGSIVQVTDTTVISSEQILSSSSYADLTSVTVSITPNSTSSKIRLIANINAKYQDATAGYGLKFFRDTTNIFTTLTDYAVIRKGTSTMRDNQTFYFLDSPSSTSSITYKVQVATHTNSEVRFHNSAQSIIYATEIKG